MDAIVAGLVRSLTRAFGAADSSVSEIAGAVGTDLQPTGRSESGERVAQAGRILSIGHGSQEENELIAQLRRENVAYVIDVRSVPYSKRNPEFARECLERSLHFAGIRYVFMGDALGGRPKDPSCYTDGRVDYRKVQAKPVFKDGINRLVRAYELGFDICLLCSEIRPSDCHRAKLIGEALAVRGITVQHLLPDGSSISQSDVIATLTHGQGNLFEHDFLSRRRYDVAALE